MKQKTNRSNKRRRESRDNSNLNMRSINNSREVSRRSKGKNRYAYEEDYRSNTKYYDENDYYQGSVKKKSSKKMDREAEKAVKKRKRRGRRKNLGSKILGYLLAIIQFFLSVFLTVNVMFFDLLPMTYILILAAVLLILLGITLLTQIAAKGKGVGGKVFCIIMCAILAAGSFFISKGYNAFEEIVGGNTKTSAIVVAVKADDPAKTIHDAKDYTFGVQYTTSKAQMLTAMNRIEDDLGKEIKKTEYSSTMQAIEAFRNGEVDAVIYNSSQNSIIEETYEAFEDEIRVIYTSRIVVEIENEAPAVDMDEPFTVYLSGIDVYGDITEESRSDVNILAVVNPTSHQVLLVTTPRDFYVPIPGISYGQRDKLTHAGIYGVDVSMNTLAELYDVEIPFYGRVNFTSMINIVNALGGLEVYSDAEFDTSEAAGEVFHVQEGMNTLNGTQALAFCRERKNLPDGDNARGRHQQAVITAIIKKMMSPAMLRGAVDILESVSDGVETNFGMEQIQSLIKAQLRTNAKWNIYSVSAEGFGDKNTCFSSGSMELYVTVPDDASVENIKELIDRVEAGEILEGSTSTTE